MGLSSRHCEGARHFFSKGFLIKKYLLSSRRYLIERPTSFIENYAELVDK
jgi:hypothetical protein